MLACALSVIGAVIGAGFASGRELESFISRYGGWSWALTALVPLITAALCYRMMKPGESRLEQALTTVLYIVLAGAMLSAAGELCALTLPVRYAREGGMAASLCIALSVSQKGSKALAWLSLPLIPLMIAAFALCLLLPASPAAGESLSVGAFPRAIGYAALNAVSARGAAQKAGEQLNRKARLYAAGIIFLILFILTALGNLVLIRHASVTRDAALPLVVVMRAYGKPGYYLTAAVMYLASLTTLAALTTRLRARTLPLVLLLATADFTSIVKICYPLLGGACLLARLARFMRRAYHDRGKKASQST